MKRENEVGSAYGRDRQPEVALWRRDEQLGFLLGVDLGHPLLGDEERVLVDKRLDGSVASVELEEHSCAVLEGERESTSTRARLVRYQVASV